MKIEIESTLLMKLVWMARRYADGRSTWVPHDFNQIYAVLMQDYPQLISNETSDKACDFFPWAQDGMFHPETGSFDARPK